MTRDLDRGPSVMPTLRRWFRSALWSVGLWTVILFLNAAGGAVRA
jgi:hypothetical protein